jgi:hypothetical protein
MKAVRLEKIMGRFTRDYLRVAKEQGIPQDLICLPAKPPQDVMTSKKGEDTKNNNKETEIYNSDSEVSGKEIDKVTQNEENNEETSMDEDTAKTDTNYHQIYIKAS